MKGLVVRSIVLAAGLLLAAAFAVDWNAVVWELARRSTNDAQLRGDTTMLSARVSGFVAQVAVTDDQPVQAGQLLYQIEDDDYRARVDRAQAMVAEAHAAVEVAQAQLATQQAQVDAARANSWAAAAQLERARLERVRQDRLLGTESALRRAWDAAVSEERRQEATLAGDRDGEAAALAQIRVLAAQVHQAEAQLQASQAALDLSRVELGYTRITAPRDGVVGQRLIRTGQYVAPGTALIALVPLADVWVRANFREEQLAGMAAGQPAEIRVDAFPGITLRGRVDSLAPDSEARSGALVPDRAVGNFTKIVQRVPVKITFDPASVHAHGLDQRLVPGLSVETLVDTALATAAPATNP